jgi:hypothetical protein
MRKAQKTRKMQRPAKCNFKNITLKSYRKKIHLPADFDLFDLKYESPIKKDLAVAFVYFNAVKSKRILMNYLYVVEKCKAAGIPVFTLEMYTGTPEISDAFHIKTEFILFQKERLCFLLEKMIPKSFTKLLFLDSDLVFDNLNWYNDISEKLNDFNVVQPFSKGVWLDITYTRIVKERIPIILFLKFGNISKSGGIGGYHPGFAWAFQREWFNRVGFFQYAILGDGDTLSSIVWLNYDHEPRDYMKGAIEEYRAAMATPPSMCLIKGNIYHLWHGDQKKRQYSSRREIFSSVKDIRAILHTERNGLFYLKSPKIKSRILKYFKNRDDDGLEL